MKGILRFTLLFFLLLFVSFNFSCRKKMICPAYNSAFILGDGAQFQFFSQFTDDSIPEVKEDLRTFMIKNEFGIIVKVKDKKKWKLMNFVSMEMILPLVDSTLLDSTGQLPIAGYNRDQIVYNRKFGELLVSEKPIERDSISDNNLQRGKKKKKSKDDEEEEEIEEIDEDDPDFDPWSTGGDANW